MPQLAVTVVFFFWPAGQAILQSVQREDAFGLSTRFVGLENFASVLADPHYLASVEITLLFSVAVASLALAPGLLLAVMANQVTRAGTLYKTLLLLPYAVAPAIAGVLWLFLFNPSVGIIAVALRRAGIDCNYILNGPQALLLVILAAAWKQISYNFLFFLAGLQAIPQSLIEAAALDGADRRRRFWQIIFPLLAPTFFFCLLSISCTLFSTPSESFRTSPRAVLRGLPRSSSTRSGMTVLSLSISAGRPRSRSS